MQRSDGRILVTHAGRLPASPEFAAEDMKRQGGAAYDTAAYDALRQQATSAVIRRQIEAGIDAISDGELGKSRGFPYYSQRIAGIAERELRPGETSMTVQKTRERERFADFYLEVDRERAKRVVTTPVGKRMICVEPLRHKGAAVIQEELAAYRAALGDMKPADAFFALLAPGWLDHFIYNEYYKTDEAFIFALAEVLRPEYKAVVDAGFILQVDDPGLADSWPTFFPEPSVPDYRKHAALRIEALNHALEGIPEDRVRYHVCWGSQHGPHVDDLPFAHVIDLMLKVRAQGYTFEAANVRHEQEWTLWQDTKLPDGKVLIPGVVGHATNLVEHPDLVAQRLVRFAELVGRENVLASTDCGLGGRVHASIAWAKLDSLVEGARRATKMLWK